MTTFDSTDQWTELEPLADLVGSARVVALGESAHHVREFYQLRHRLTRFLLECCGFTVIALEAPVTEAAVLQRWIDGGEGSVAQVAHDGIAMSLGDCRQLHEQLEWLRANNTTDASAGQPRTRVSCVGVDLPGSVGSALPTLTAIRAHLAATDPIATAHLDEAIEIARLFHDSAGLNVLSRYPALDTAQRDTYTALLNTILMRLQRSSHRRSDNCHSHVVHQLRAAVHLDEPHRGSLTEGFEAASTFRDLFMAESISRLVENTDARVVFAAHNWHIKKTLVDQPDGVLLPAGHHLATSLGDDYQAIGLTSVVGRTAIAATPSDHPEGFVFREPPLPPAPPESLEAGLPSRSPWYLTDLTGAGSAITTTPPEQHAHVRLLHGRASLRRLRARVGQSQR